MSLYHIFMVFSTKSLYLGYKSRKQEIMFYFCISGKFIMCYDLLCICIFFNGNVYMYIIIPVLLTCFDQTSMLELLRGNMSIRWSKWMVSSWIMTKKLGML